MEDPTNNTVSRKRKAGATGPSENGINSNSNNNISTTPTPPIPPSSTIESLLAVPLEIIFRQIPNNNPNNNAIKTLAIAATTAGSPGKPLLTRAEARCLLQVTMLAQEFDCLVQTTNEALNMRLSCRSFGQKLLNNGSSFGTTSSSASTSTNPFLRPLLPLLSLHGCLLTTNALCSVETELHRILVQLHNCRQSLRQFSEQNWTLSDSLLEALGGNCNGEDPDWMASSQQDDNGSTTSATPLPKGAVLAREKRRLSDLQEEVCNRIDSLLGQAENSNNDTAAPSQSQSQSQRERGDDTSITNNNDSDENSTMAGICAQLWNLSGVAAKPVHNNNSNNNNDDHQPSLGNNSQQQQQQHQQKADDLFSYPETIQGLDQKMMHDKQQQQQQHEGEEMQSATPMTIAAALDDQSKPQGIPDSSAEAQEQDDHHNNNNNSDDDETVGEDGAQQDNMELDDDDEEISEPAGAVAAAAAGAAQGGESSQRSIVSNTSLDPNDPNQQQQQQQQQQQVPRYVGAPPTQSQAHALLSFHRG